MYKSIASFLIPSLLLFVPALITGDDLRNVYGSTNTKWVTGTFTKSIRQYLKDIAIALGYFIYNFWYFILPGLFGIYHRFRRPSQLNIFLAIGFLIPFAFGTFYNVSDNYVYFIGPYQIFLIYVVDGLVQFSKKYNKTLVISSVLALMMPLMYVISYQIVLKTPQGQAFHQFKKYKGGLNYYLYPWMNNNVGVLEFTIEKRPSPEDIYWMKTVSRWFIENRMKKGDTLEEIKGM
ncbi:hypothetical protein [Daejeonia sp. YH14]|uniref:hypothetical protein n=1 Tax=Daejeonia sp. YH14 TaxID=3439042 RepID=UPI003F4907B3